MTGINIETDVIPFLREIVEMREVEGDDGWDLSERLETIVRWADNILERCGERP